MDSRMEEDAIPEGCAETEPCCVADDTEVTSRLLQTSEGEGPVNDDQRNGGVKTNIGGWFDTSLQDVRMAWRQLQSSSRRIQGWSRFLQPNKFVQNTADYAWQTEIQSGPSSHWRTPVMCFQCQRGCRY